MKRSIGLFALCAGGLLLVGASSPERPTLQSCGDHLPEGAHLSLEMEATWNRREGSHEYEISTSYRDEATGQPPERITQELDELTRCVKLSLGA